MFTIYWGEVSADSDGPIEMCRPVPAADATALATHYPELSLEPSLRITRRSLRSRTGARVGTKECSGSSRSRL